MLSNRVTNLTPSLTFKMVEKVAEMRARGIDIISFCVGEPDFETPKFVIEAAKRAMDEGKTKYTATSGIIPLKQAICDKLKRDNGLTYTPAQIVVSNGGKQSLFNTLMSTVNPGDEVIMFAPFWLTYLEQVKLCGGVPVIVNVDEKDDFVPTAKALRAAITPKTKIIMLNTPNNPTGAVYSEKQLRELARVIEESNAYLIADEIYEKLVYGKTPHWSIANYSKKLYDKTIIVNGFSKAFAMTGWRMGYTASSPELAAAISGIQSHSTQNVNTITQWAGIEALNNPQSDATIADMVRQFKERREHMRARLTKMPHITCTNPQGAFYMIIDVRKLGKPALAIADELLDDYHIATTALESFGLPGYIRFSYALGIKEMDEGLDRLEKYLKNVKI